MKQSAEARRDVAHAMAWGVATACLIIAGIWLGSRHFKDFDPALVPYAGATVFAGFGLGYRYGMWLRRPPTRLYWKRGWQLFLAPNNLVRNLTRLIALFGDNFVRQRFIERRSRLRWAAHFCISWGCILAAAITFPLSFGWIRFETPLATQNIYDLYVFGIRVFSFPWQSIVAVPVFNALDFAATMVLIGVFLALWRRGRGRDALAVQQFGNDLLPLVLLLSISMTGVFLTVSTHFLHSIHYEFLAQLHAITVIFTLLYLPFGKFFHIFQRPAQLSIRYYKQAGAEGEQARCLRCGLEFGSRLHIDDLKAIEQAIGVEYRLENGAHYQDVCPPCRRKNLALTQGALWRAAGRGMGKEFDNGQDPSANS